MKQKQRGISFLGLLFVGAVVAIVAVVAAQVAPTVMEYQAILKAAKRAVETGNTVTEIRTSFDKSKAADYFEAVSGRDLQISKENDKIIVEFAYDKEIHLAGPAYLVMKYRGRTE
jgi:type II secretory pathway pseudopilin PulG